MVTDSIKQVSDWKSHLRGVMDTSSRSFLYLGACLVVLSILSGLTTYVILTGLTPIIPTHSVVVTVLLINAVFALAMMALIAWQIMGLWGARRRQQAGARLHVRIVGLFSIIALIPAVLLAVFASVSLDRGLDQWFSKRTKLIVKNSVNVATAYLNEHGQVIRSDAISMAADIDAAASLAQNPAKFGRFLTAQATIRSVPVAYLIDENSKLLASAGPLYKNPYVPPPDGAIDAAKAGKAVVIAPGKTNKVAAVKKLDDFTNTYLYIVRPVNPQVLQHLRQTRATVAEYRSLAERRTGVQIAFALMYIAIALTLLLAAIWIGLWFANRLVAPIRQLIGAAQEVSSGNLAVQVSPSDTEGDLRQLGTTFNSMTEDLREQRDELVDTNAILDERRRFIETVLSGVTAGIIGLDTKGKITLANRSAENLLGAAKKPVTGKAIATAIPEFSNLFERAKKANGKPVQEQIQLVRSGQEYNYAARVTSEQAGARHYGYVVTFDDITELVSAQRSTAWADIARRIAHEIKNPLTPIQLSAERIRRKYGESITHDREIFDRCTDTIIRQVGDIGRMVDEFSAFARMPKPNMALNDVGKIVSDAVFLFQVSRPDINFEIDTPAKPVTMNCDERLMAQAVTNLVKNASEAIGEDSKGEGLVLTRIRARAGRVIVEVIDNGIGLPKENRNRLVEPYMTTREKGTGLGLAIVQKIVEQHGGRLQLRDAPKMAGTSSGACVRIDFPELINIPDMLKPVAKSDVKKPRKTTRKPRTRGKKAKSKTTEQRATNGV